MAFRLADHWVWDFWFADDGRDWHMYFLQAPRALGDPDKRHRNARIGHATSADLRHWKYLGEVLAPGAKGEPDETATWTGSVVRGADGIWRMFYTGASFPNPDANTNIESVMMATSPDLHTWTKREGFVLKADPRWYETLGTSSWPEEAWRDPYVFADPSGRCWHMLVTARANQGPDAGRGVVGHATSPDLGRWEIQPPLSAPAVDFDHLEVMQIISPNGAPTLVFSCDKPRLRGARAGQGGGIWLAPGDGLTTPVSLADAHLLAPESIYAGRVFRDRSGQWVLMGFAMNASGGKFDGSISDPVPLDWDERTGTLRLAEPVGEHA
jgi:beta-fructofuranosidase